MAQDTLAESFTRFVTESEPKLRRALIAGLGTETGREATAEALAYGWEHWERVGRMENPAGYLYRVGRSRVRRRYRRPVMFASAPSSEMPLVEPGLAGALAELSERQRISVMLVYGYGWTFEEVAKLVGVSSRGTIQRHARRGLDRIRTSLAVTVND